MSPSLYLPVPVFPKWIVRLDCLCVVRMNEITIRAESDFRREGQSDVLHFQLSDLRCTVCQRDDSMRFL